MHCCRLAVRRHNDIIVSLVHCRLDVNVALNRPSYQVNTYSDADRVYYASYANDGNNDTNIFSGPCASTMTATHPWWAVDLTVPLKVHSVKFTNRDYYGK